MTKSQPPAAAPVRHVIVVGGGTAGYFAALALKSALPDLSLTLIESSRIPIIGVGEATTTLMPPFLHRQLGLDIVAFYRDVRPTWKLGIRFEWGLPGEYYFNYPFGSTAPIEAFAQDGELSNQSLISLMMSADRVPMMVGDDGAIVSLLREAKLAYHLDNKPFVAYLKASAQQRGITHIDAEISDVQTSADRERVERLVLTDGRTLDADLYVDASGFRALLIERALGSPFESYASSLFCDSAVVGTVAQPGAIRPYTTAETMDAGWCWRIPVQGEDHRGYVFSSAHLDLDHAQAEMEARNPGLQDVWSLRFRSGRHREFWKGNTVAVGNAYGFVEPLESTALHMVITELGYLIGGLRDARAGEPDRAFANQAVGAHWDFLRWFLSVHYKFNRRKDTPFWRDCRAGVDVSGMAPLLERFSDKGPWDQVGSLQFGDFAFSFEGLMVLLLGQHAPCPRPTGTKLAPARWQAVTSEYRALLARTVDHRRALDVLAERADLLHEFVESPTSWINRSNMLMPSLTPDTGSAKPPSDLPLPPCGAYDYLFAPPWFDLPTGTEKVGGRGYCA